MVCFTIKSLALCILYQTSLINIVVFDKGEQIEKIFQTEIRQKKLYFESKGHLQIQNFRKLFPILKYSFWEVI